MDWLRRTVSMLVLGAAALAACGSDEGPSAAERGVDAGMGGSAATSGSGGTGGGSGATGGSGGSVSLACDPGFSFSPDPPESGAALTVDFTHAEPLTYVELRASGPTQPGIGSMSITQSDPWTWSYPVTGLAPGVYAFEFWADSPSRHIASCQKQVIDTGPAPDAGSGGSGGTGGSGATGGSGGHCCNIVGTQLANPSPCGPSEQDSPWQTLDNAGCNANGGCQRIWCPYEKCDSARYPNGCPQGTEACWIDDSHASYEDACRSCCESYGACWDQSLSTCRHPGDCGSAIWKCPWEP